MTKAKRREMNEAKAAHDEKTDSRKKTLFPEYYKFGSKTANYGYCILPIFDQEEGLAKEPENDY